MAENIPTWILWQAIQTQVKTVSGPMGGAIIGIDYLAAYAVARTLLIDITPAVLRKIQALESIMIQGQEASKGSGNNNPEGEGVAYPDE